MKSTLEVLTEDLQQMQKEREQAVQTVQMYNGAIQYLEQKISELSPKKEPVKSEPKSEEKK